MNTDLTCSCENAQTVSEANSEGAVHCSHCGRPIVRLGDAETPMPQGPNFAMETQQVGRPIAIPHQTTSSRYMESGAETRIMTPMTGVTESDDFEIVHPSAFDVESQSTDSQAKVDDDMTVLSTRVDSLAGKRPSHAPSGSRRGSGTSRTGEIDLKQPIMATQDSPRLPTVVSQLDNGLYGCHRILRSHQEGGMGQILIAYDQFLKREVALKKLRPEVIDDWSVVQRFIGEAEITAQLEHPGIVPVHMLGLNDDNPYYTMKLIKGHTFQEAIKDYHHKPTEGGLRNLVRRLVSVCKTISFAHMRGVIHRDLKPANVMLGEHGETLVMDWGLAKSFLHPVEETASFTAAELVNEDRREARPELTMVGSIVGTLAFMSPEQASPESGTVGPLSDIFSLGAVLYYLLTGQTAFSGRSTQDILAKVRKSELIKPSLIRSYIPSDLEAVCLKAMERNPSDRYQSTDEMGDDLCRWLDNEPVLARKETFTQKVWRRIKKNRRVSMSIPTILALIILMGIVGAVIDNIGRGRSSLEIKDAILNQVVDLFQQPSIDIKGGRNISFSMEKKRAETKPPSLRIAVLREGEARLTVIAPPDLTWDLTSRQFLTFSMLELEQDGAFPVGNFFVRLGQGSGYFEYRPTNDWWGKQNRGTWLVFSVPLDGSASWTKTEHNAPSMEQIRWIELHFETEKPTTFWIDNLMFLRRKSD